jgi:hypothetical protein
LFLLRVARFVLQVKYLFSPGKSWSTLVCD